MIDGIAIARVITGGYAGSPGQACSAPGIAGGIDGGVIIPTPDSRFFLVFQVGDRGLVDG